MPNRELELVLRLAKMMCENHCLGMDDEDPRKGIGNRLADALKAYEDAAQRPQVVCLCSQRPCSYAFCPHAT